LFRKSNTQISVLKQEHFNRTFLTVGIALSALTLLAWGYLIREAHAMTVTGACCCAGMKMSGPDVSAWSAATLLPLFLMWTEMMVAMMLPSATPMVLTFAAVNRKRKEREAPSIPAFLFLSGYLVVWTIFSLVAAVGQWVLHGLSLLSTQMTTTSSWLGAVLFIAAGVFQWTPLKNSCLAHCRSPLAFLMTSWREGAWGAFRMGFTHGLWCMGCCWILMLLLFAVGVMNLAWVAALTLLVVGEKLVPSRYRMGQVAGVLLVLFGVWILLRPQVG
jgi:predicted metal-binding membrane protein